MPVCLQALAAEPIYNVNRPRVILIPVDMSFAPDASISWPPPGGLSFEDPVTLTGPPSNSTNRNRTSNSNSNLPIWQQATVEVDSGFSNDVLFLPRTSRSGQLALRQLQLAGALFLLLALAPLPDTFVLSVVC